MRRSWDTKERVIEPKTAAGTRSVPIAALLRSALVAHRLASLCTGDDDLVLGHGLRPFFARTVTDRAESAWTTARLQRITPHECRHTYASRLIAANVNAKAPSTYMGHASVTITRSSAQDDRLVIARAQHQKVPGVSR